jgi:uracil-DNA glycosylase
VPTASSARASRAPARLADLVHPSWVPALSPVAERIEALSASLRAERAGGRAYLPDDDRVLEAFGQPFDDVRILLVGQDPYPTPGHAVGLAFSVAPEVRPLPRSLANIFRELTDDVGVPPPTTGELTAWTRAGVLLLNRVLTVSPGLPGSHRGRGWEAVTDHVVRALAQRGRPLVAILWGREAQAVRPLLGGVPIVQSAHPSPLSASRGFFGSRPFSRASELLRAQGGEPVDWRLP